MEDSNGLDATNPNSPGSDKSSNSPNPVSDDPANTASSCFYLQHMHVFPLGSLQMLARICSFWSQKIAVQPVQQSTEKKKKLVKSFLGDVGSCRPIPNTTSEFTGHPPRLGFHQSPVLKPLNSDATEEPTCMRGTL